jgi:hypothetical protein
MTRWLALLQVDAATKPLDIALEDYAATNKKQESCRDSKFPVPNAFRSIALLDLKTTKSIFPKNFLLIVLIND